MYDLSGYRSMVSDAVRVDAYARALRATVRPDDVVLDLGCGIGLFAVLAARCGARRVFGVEPNDCVQYARRVAEENGVADRLTLWRGRIQDVELPERPTLLVGDVRGVLPFDVSAVGVWNAALAKLAPGARTIPRQDTILAQPVRSDAMHAATHGFGPVVGVTLESIRRPLTNGRESPPEDTAPLDGPSPLFTLDYGRPLAPNRAGEAAFVAPAPWTLDGFVVGFEADLGAGVTYRSFGPGRATAYGQCFLPCTTRLEVPAGSRVALRFETYPVQDQTHFRWAVDHAGREGVWQGRLFEECQSLDVLRAGLPDHVPAPDAGDDLDAAILTAFREGVALGRAVEIARRALPPGVSAERVHERAMDLARRRQERQVRRLGR